MSALATCIDCVVAAPSKLIRAAVIGLRANLLPNNEVHSRP